MCYVVWYFFVSLSFDRADFDYNCHNYNKLAIYLVTTALYKPLATLF